jgi:hypothetical protein
MRLLIQERQNIADLDWNSAKTIPGLGAGVDGKVEGLRDAVVHEGEVCRLVTLMVGAWNHRKVIIS